MILIPGRLESKKAVAASQTARGYSLTPAGWIG
jgi:hypothetical protein